MQATTSDIKKAGPLAGLCVLDLSRVVAGPFCTMQLGDLGAEVIKVESPHGGDDSRNMKPPEIEGESPMFLAFNRNKKSVVLDLRSEAGLAEFRTLAVNCDILVENFRPGVMARLGLDYAAMAKLNKQLIYCSISAYGQTGSMSARPGFDPILQAEMGMMALNGEPDGVPLRHPLSISDMLTGFYAVTAILAAVHARATTGVGQLIDVCLMDSVIAVLSNAAQHHLQTGMEPPRSGNVFLPAAPASLFPTQTDPIYLSAISNKLFATLCGDVLDQPGLAEDSRFRTNTDRVRNRTELFALLEQALATGTAEHWNVKMRAAGIPVGIVRKVSDALRAEEVVSRGMVVEVQHPTMGALQLLGTPFNFSGTPLPPPQPPPVLDQHHGEVFGSRALLAGQSAEHFGADAA